MMFYTTIAGWMFIYIGKMAKGEFAGLDAKGVEGVFDGMKAQPGQMVFWMVVVVIAGFAVCALGLQKGDRES